MVRQNQKASEEENLSVPFHCDDYCKSVDDYVYLQTLYKVEYRIVKKRVVYEVDRRGALALLCSYRFILPSDSKADVMKLGFWFR